MLEIRKFPGLEYHLSKYLTDHPGANHDIPENCGLSLLFATPRVISPWVSQYIDCVISTAKEGY